METRSLEEVGSLMERELLKGMGSLREIESLKQSPEEVELEVLKESLKVIGSLEEIDKSIPIWSVVKHAIAFLSHL